MKKFMVCIGILAIAGIFLTSGAAQADPWGTGTSDTGYRPDANNQTYCIKDNIPSYEVGLIKNMMDSAITDDTQANAQYQGRTTACVVSGAEQTDMVFVQGDTNGNYGTTACQVFRFLGSAHPQCDRNVITMDRARMKQDYPDNIFTGSPDPDFTAEYKHVACHEAGHAMGLTHGGPTSGPYDCMSKSSQYGDPTDQGSSLFHYRAHHINYHLDPWFCCGTTNYRLAHF